MGAFICDLVIGQSMDKTLTLRTDRHILFTGQCKTDKHKVWAGHLDRQAQSMDRRLGQSRTKYVQDTRTEWDKYGQGMENRQAQSMDRTLGQSGTSMDRAWRTDRYKAWTGHGNRQAQNMYRTLG